MANKAKAWKECPPISDALQTVADAFSNAVLAIVRPKAAITAAETAEVRSKSLVS